MLGVSFVNPNYNPVYEGKVRYVENLLECFTTENAREQLCIYYSGFQYGNLRMGLRKAGLEEVNSYFWDMNQFYPVFQSFKKGTLTEVEIPGKTFNQKDATLKIYAHNGRWKLSISNEIEYEIGFSIERFSYLLERISLGYLQYLFSKIHENEVLSDKEIETIKAYHLPVMAFKKIASELFKFHKGIEPRPFYEVRNMKLCSNYFKSAMVLLYLGELPFYLSFASLCLISKDIHTGRYFKLFGRTSGPLYKECGGTHSDKAKREDNSPLARTFTILSGPTADELIFKIETGKGKYDNKRAITMVKVEHTETITLGKDECTRMANRYEKFLMAYLIEQYLKDESISADKQVINQIDKINAKNTFVASVARAFNMKKIRLDFAQYSADYKQEKYADIYLTEQDFNMLYQKTFSGAIAKEIIQLNKDKKPFGSAFSVTCGTAAEAANRGDHKALCKTLQISPSTASDCTLFACKGSGKQDKDKKFIMSKVEDRIYVPMKYDSLKKLLLVTMFYWKAYKIAQTVALEKLQKSKNSEVA